MSSPAEGDSRHRVFVAFAGGGAKAIIHVGALKALEEKEVDFRGIAGTSAGAIIAALKAAGFRADELVDPASKRTILDALGKIDPKITKATDLFGRGGWWRIRIFRWAMDQSKFRRRVTLVAIWASPILIAFLPMPLHPDRILPVVVVLWTLVGVTTIWIYVSLLRGLANITRFRNALSVLFQQRMFPAELGRVVRMSDFGGSRPTLKIVTANLNRQKLQLFSPERTPDVPVADAVAASICLPAIFGPWRIDGELHIDGGIVSNLPAWPFDEERELDPDALTIAVEISDRGQSDDITISNWPGAAIRTALFGSGELDLRVFGEAESILLETSVDLLQFDISLDQVCREVEDATNASLVRLDKRLFRRPALFRDACSVTQALASDVLESVLQGSIGTLRVALGVMDRGYNHSLRLRYTVGYASHLDERMLVPLEGSIHGEAWKTKETQFEVAPFPDSLNLPGDANRFRRKALWPDLKWQLCIPILNEKQKIRLVVQIDGDKALPVIPAIEAAVTRIESDVREFFVLMLKELAQLEDENGLEEQYVPEI
jgi:NTE family protein